MWGGGYCASDYFQAIVFAGIFAKSVFFSCEFVEFKNGTPALSQKVLNLLTHAHMLKAMFCFRGWGEEVNIILAIQDFGSLINPFL